MREDPVTANVLDRTNVLALTVNYTSTEDSS